MTMAVHPGPQILREAAARLARDPDAKPGLADVKRHAMAYLLGRFEYSDFQRAELVRLAMTVLEDFGRHRAVPETVGETVDHLRNAADWWAQLDLQAQGGAS